MKNNYHVELFVTDEGSLVKAALRDAEGLVLDYENNETKPVRVIYPLPNREDFIERAESWVKEGMYASIEESVKFYLTSREKEIFDQVQEIRKSMKRIKRALEAMKIAKEEMRRYQSEKA